MILFLPRSGPTLYLKSIQKDEKESNYRGNGVNNSKAFYLKSTTTTQQLYYLYSAKYIGM